MHQISSDLRSQAAQGPVSTRVGDRLGSPSPGKSSGCCQLFIALVAKKHDKEKHNQHCELYVMLAFICSLQQRSTNRTSPPASAGATVSYLPFGDVRPGSSGGEPRAGPCLVFSGREPPGVGGFFPHWHLGNVESGEWKRAPGRAPQHGVTWLQLEVVGDPVGVGLEPFEPQTGPQTGPKRRIDRRCDE